MKRKVQGTVQGMVQGIDPKKLSTNTEIIDRLKKAIGAETDRDLAKFLNVKPQNITTAKRRRIPEKWIVTVGNITGYPISYFLSGDLTEQQAPNLSDNKILEESTIFSKHSPGLGETVDILAEILRSGDAPIIQALHSNLLAFREAVQSTVNVAKLQEENQRLKEENARLNARLESLNYKEISERLENIQRLYRDNLDTDGPDKRKVIFELGKILGLNSLTGTI
jgi:hypothetical protein